MDNIIDVWGIWLDNDSGDLTKEEFTRIFPDIKMIVYNSFNSTADKPRWRVVIPTTGPMTADVYKEIINQIMKKLNNRNYYSKDQLEKRKKSGTTTEKDRIHGFDRSKFVASSQFYLPIQAGAGESDSFLEIYNDNKRQAINPRQWIDRTSKIDYEETGLSTSRPKNINSRGPINSDAEEAAINRWRQCSPGSGNDEFFILARSLMNARETDEYISDVLNQEAAHSHSETSANDRRRDIPRIISGLRPQASPHFPAESAT